MVSSVTGYTDTRNRAWTNEGYDGVVLLTVGNYQGSGALLYGGRAVLTAAHLFEDGVTSAQVTFQTATGTQTLACSKVWIHPAYDALNTNNDLAIVWLTDQAPAAANRYDLYRSSDEVGQTMTLVGYGLPGTGATGTLTNYGGAPIRQKASNTFDSDVGRLTTVYGNDLSWAPQAGTQLLADFDNGRSTNDALGRLLGLSNTGLGSNEGIITPGDSGGPAFIAGKVAGGASYITSLSTSTTHPDIDSQINSSYGEIAAWQRVSAYQQVIDQTLRANQPGAPTRADQVQSHIIEGDSGLSLGYFWISLPFGRPNPSQPLSVTYATRDGTAKSGEDYLASSSTLVFYPGEDHVALPVEVIGDTAPEQDEYFFLDVTSPGNGSISPITLSAIRIIVNDDVLA